jgi:hypothetical protein
MNKLLTMGNKFKVHLDEEEKIQMGQEKKDIDRIDTT